MIKPDGVSRGFVGECINRIERSGLKIVAMKMLTPTPAQIEKHYPSSEEWFRKVGQRTLDRFAEEGKDVKAKFGTTDSLEIGKKVKSWLVRTLSSGPVVLMIIEGYRAIENVRKITGATDAVKAEAGSIRGDFSIDSAGLGNDVNRPIANVIHASGDKEEAANEIKLWFKESEIQKYKRCDEDIFYRVW